MLERIALAYDRSGPSEGAAGIAVALAVAGNAELILLHVKTPDSTVDEADLARLARDAPGGIAIETRLLHGDPAGELQELLQRERVDLIVAGTHGTGRLRAALLGSVSRALLDSAPCAVRLVRDRDAALGAGPILVGLDQSPQARAAAITGGLIATALSAPLLLVHVLGGYVPFVDGEQPAALLKERADLGRKLLGDVRAALALPAEAVEQELREGASAGEELLAACAEHRPRLAIVGHRGRSRIVSELLGSTAREVADHAPCPVIVSRWVGPARAMPGQARGAAGGAPL
jgi:nucleotide-binding universal stress UspA family protein